jgi:hypothetical protein
MTIKTNYYCGNRVSRYGIEHKRVDYAMLAKAFDAVLCNDITKLFYNSINGIYTEPELINGDHYDSDADTFTEIYQYYIISSNGARLLQDYTDEIVYYIDYLDMYIWGVTHFGTSWSYVLTDIEIDTTEDSSND